MRGLLIGKTALLPMLRSAPLPLSIGTAGSQEVLALQRVYVIDAHKRFFANNVIVRFDDILSALHNPLVHRKLTYVNIEARSSAPQFPTWG